MTMTALHEVHPWSRCHHCGMDPIYGPRFCCETCPAGPDVDLCSTCHGRYLSGEVPHPAPDSIRIQRPTQRHHFKTPRGNRPEALIPWLQIPCPELRAPEVPRGFLVRPEFRSAEYSAFSTYGFISQGQAGAVLLTALHVMDELIKYKRIDTTVRNRNYSGTELPHAVTAVRLYDVLDARWMLHPVGAAGPMLVLPNARTGDDEPLSWRDIAAFSVQPSAKLTPLRLAAAEPEPGDALWLAARMTDDSRTRRAVCVEITPQTLVFRYEETKTAATQTSGAAILDRDGAVVGIHAGRGRFEGQELGHANPLGSIRRHLIDARSGAPTASRAMGSGR
jgi:hypothetical protein